MTAGLKLHAVPFRAGGGGELGLSCLRICRKGGNQRDEEKENSLHSKLDIKLKDE